MIRKVGMIVLVLIAFAFVGFSRDFIFLNTNRQLAAKLYDMDFYNHNFTDVLRNFSYWTIYTLKWVFTIFFALVFYFLQRFVLVKSVKANFVKKWLNYLYLFLVILSGIALGIGWMMGNIDKGYTFSRIFMGILQSPLPIMFLLPVAYSIEKMKESK